MHPDKLLHRFRLSQTSTRIEILEVLNDSNLALSMNEIKHRLKGKFDRVTLYRNLKVMTEKGILHQIKVDHLDSKYTMPLRATENQEANPEHPHFKCVQCNRVKCLTDQHPEPLTLPEGYEKIEVNFMVYGICKDCKS